MKEENIETLFNSQPTFEDMRNENGFIYWWASDLMIMLGYKDMKTFQKVIERATKAFMSLNISHYDNIVPTDREDNTKDFKLTRFACYLIAMNGDPKKVEVANAQAYFISQSRQFELYLEGQNEIERIVNREEFMEGHKLLSSTAHQAGAENYAKFMDAGYLGMYNMHRWELSKRRKIDIKNPKKMLDRMGRLELAANTFRLTLTEERIKNRNIKGQFDLEEAHRNVGKEVREVVIKNIGITPENLPQEKELPAVKKELKKLEKGMEKLDKPPKKKK